MSKVLEMVFFTAYGGSLSTYEKGVYSINPLSTTKEARRALLLIFGDNYKGRGIKTRYKRRK